MARLFRFLEKKRGQRRTGSNLVGSVGEAVFYGTLFVLGVLAVQAVCRPLVTAVPGWVRRVPVYAMGSLAAYWWLERTAVLLRR